MDFKDRDEKQSELEEAAKEARKEENPSDEIEEAEDRKVDKGKDLERDESGTKKTEEEIQDAYE